MLSAYLLVSHGSSDPRHQGGLSRLATLMRQHLDRSLWEEWHPTAQCNSRVGDLRESYASVAMAPLPLRSGPRSQSGTFPRPVVGMATLEMASVPLAQQIVSFARRAMAQGIHQVVILPLFLQAGVHVKEDLPREIATAQSLLPSRLRLVCTPHLGSCPGFKQFVAARLGAAAADRYLLVAHGSRRTSGNRSIQQLGAVLDAEVAFWSVPPDLETQVVALMQQGHQQIAIAPYFLFPGSITDAITRRTEDLAERLPQVSLRLLPPLGTHGALAKVVVDLGLSAPHPVGSHTWQRESWSVAGKGMMA